MADDEDTHDLSQILSSSDRDFLIHNNNEQIPVSSLVGKIVGLYFCGVCPLNLRRRFTPKLVELYEQLGSTEGNKFEVVCIPCDTSEELFSENYDEMPWLAIPFSDSETRNRLSRLFKVSKRPKLVILDSTGKVITYKGTSMVLGYGADGFPFTSEKIDFLNQKNREARQNQPLSSTLARFQNSPKEKSILISNTGNWVHVSELDDKIVGLYFSKGFHTRCNNFNPLLLSTYNELKEMGMEFEVVLISQNQTEIESRNWFTGMPWLALPFKDNSSALKLRRYFDIPTLPGLVIIGQNGKTFIPNAVKLITEHGSKAYPFTPEKLAQVGEQLREAEVATTEDVVMYADHSEGVEVARKRLKTDKYHVKQLELIYKEGNETENDHRLHSDDKNKTWSTIFLRSDYLISNNGMQVFVSELENKMVGLYFSKNSDKNCQRFTPFLMKTYNELKQMGKDFEVVLVSQDPSETQFRQGFGTMPWLALPFQHKAGPKLVHCYNLCVLPTLVILGPDRETLIPNATEIIEDHGSSAYPFSSEKLTQLDKQLREAQTLKYLLSSEDKQCVVDRFGSTEEVSCLVGKSILIFFSAKHIPECETFLPELIQTYNELMENDDFEVVFVSGDHDFRSFSEHLDKMPWFALPYNDKRIRFLFRWFNILDLPRLVVIAPSGKTTTLNGVNLVREFGADAFPFTSERINSLREKRREANQSCQTWRSIFDSTDVLFKNDMNLVPISDLENKPVGLYFSKKSDPNCDRFHPFLLRTYNKLKQDGMAFEVVLISRDGSKDELLERFTTTPWLIMPFGKSDNLIKQFKIESLPGLVIIGPSGDTLIPNAVDVIIKHGYNAYPFTREKLTEIDKQRDEEQTLEQLLIFEDDDTLLSTISVEQVSNLVGKHVLLFFSAEHFPQSVTFLPKLIETYNELKQNSKEFEVVFVSCDRDLTKFSDHYAKMPWLALPYDDRRSIFLKRWFDIKEHPRVVVIGPSGRTMTTEALYLISVHGAKAFPFDEAHLLGLRNEFTTISKRWPKICQSKRKHEHLLRLAFKEVYECPVCSQYGICWCYNCEVCDLYLHPRCVFKCKE